MRWFILKVDKKHHFVVRVFDTKAEMWAYFERYRKQNHLDYQKPDFGAIVMPYEVRNSITGELADDIGEILFYKGLVGAGVVAHEMGHAALWVERLLNGNKTATFGESNNDDEERFLYLLSNLTKNVVKKFYKISVY